MMSHDRYDKKSVIKKGLEELAAEVQVPDVALAFEKYKRRRLQKTRLNTVAAAVVVAVLLIVAVIPRSAQAFKGFLRITITRMITETSQLFQRSEEGSEGVMVVDVNSKQFDTLTELKKEQATGVYIPSDLSSDQFISAEIFYDQFSKVKRGSIEVLYSEELPVHFIYHTLGDSQGTYGRVIDVEDFMASIITINDLDIASFSDDQGFTLLEWENRQFAFMLYGDATVEELIKAGLSLGTFN